MSSDPTPHATIPAALFRRATPADRAAVQALVAQAVRVMPHVEAPSYFLRLAFAGRSEESRVLIGERHGDAVGCVLFGDVAGASGSGRIHFVTVSPHARASGIGSGLCRAALRSLGGEGARSVVAELPDEPSFVAGRALLARCGFAEVARIDDYYRDGVDLVVLQRIITADA